MAAATPKSGTTTNTSLPEQLDVLVVGAGSSGIAAAYYLSCALPSSAKWVVVEKGSAVGGTWHFNTYPGACCDVASHFYSFSFAPNARWSHRFSPQAEIREYFERSAKDIGLLGSPRLRLSTTVVSAVWSDAASAYDVVTRDASGVERHARARFIVAGPGALSTPSIPAFPGAASFRGATWHSAKWNHSVDLTGKRVGIIGTGCSTAQIVPAIIGKAAHVTVFQRTPMWVVPRGDYAYSERTKWLFAHVPLLIWVYRMLVALWHESRYFVFIRPAHPSLAKIAANVSNRQRARHVKDPVLLAKLTPQYPLGCKRVVISDDYLRSMGRPNASLVTGPILRIEAGGVMTGPERVGGAPVADAAAETAHNLDVLIYATGFDIVGSMDSVHVVGRDGMMIRDKYGPRGGPEAYLGITVPGLPNLCMLMGPNTGLGHSSMITMIEAQARYAAELISGAMRSGYKTVEVKEPECDAYNKELQGQLLKSVWSGCTSWYNMQGTKNIVLWPFTVTRYHYETWRVLWNKFTCK